MILKWTQFGDPVLRETARPLEISEMTSARIQQLIAHMRETLVKKKLGIGLAAPQVGEGIALAVIAIRPLAHRQTVEPFDLTIINPEITETYGRKKPLWEGCISSGPSKRGFLFAQVPRYEKIRVKYYDETGAYHYETYEGLQAHAIQHEVDHLRGTLFVDRVKDTSTYMTYAEYMKRVRKALKKAASNES